MRFTFRGPELISAHIAHGLNWKGSTNVLKLKGASFKFSVPIDSKPVSSRWVQTPRLRYLSPRSNVKGSPCIVKPYLPRLLCTKPIIKVETSPINSIADHKTHLQVIHVILRHDSFHTTLQGHLRLTTWKRTFLQRCKLWQQLGYMDKETLFPYWPHHGISRRRCGG